jgi:hypothetical protein
MRSDRSIMAGTKRAALLGGGILGVLLVLALTGPQFGAVSLISSSAVTTAREKLTSAVAG